MIRLVALRVLGLGVAAAVLAAATQWLVLGLEFDPLVGRSWIDDVTAEMTRRPREGVELLAGIALVALALVALWAAASIRAGARPSLLVHRGRGGWTRVDRTSLADAIARALEPIDRRCDILVRVGPRRRVDVRVVTPDPGVAGPVPEYRAALLELIERRHLPVRPGRFVVTTPRRTRRRVR